MNRETRPVQDYKLDEDETLLRLIIDGDEAAFEELYDRYSRLLFSVAIHMVGDRGAAEEVAMDAFTQVWRKAGSYRSGRAAVSTWLVSITRYRAIDWLRRRQARPESNSVVWTEANSPDSPLGRPEKAAGLHLRQERIRAAFRELPEEQQEVLFLGYFHDMSQSQIAERLDLPLGTVKTRVRLGLKKLRFLLREEWMVENE